MIPSRRSEPNRGPARAVEVVLLVGLSVSLVGRAWALPVPNNPPPGWKVEAHFEAPASRLAAFEQRLGCSLKSLSNTDLSKDGRKIKVNVIVCADEAGAAKVQGMMIRGHNGLKQAALREGTSVVEFVTPDVAFLMRARRELGYLPGRVVYDVGLNVAPLVRSDDMSWNKLFNRCLAIRRGTIEGAALDSLAAMLPAFEFDSTLCLRRFGQGGTATAYRFPQPPRETAEAAGGAVECRFFPRLPLWHGIPAIELTARVTVEAQGLSPTSESPSVQRHPVLRTTATPRFTHPSSGERVLLL